MPNPLDEVSGPVNTEGQDVNVINRQLPATDRKGEERNPAGKR